VINNFSASCIDAGLLIRLVVDPDDHATQAWWRQWSLAQPELLAPTLLPYEVVNGIYRLQRYGSMQPSSARAAIDAALAVPIRLIGDSDLCLRALDFATRLSLPAAYDAHYLALADRLGVQFYTLDERLYRTVHATLRWVHLVGEGQNAG
jgi:predicted nucleic acid-binding protein